MISHKFADQYTPADLTTYFTQKLKEEGCSPFPFKEPLLRAARQVLEAFDKRGDLAVVVLDSLFQHPPFEGEPSEKWLSPGVYRVAIDEMGGLRQPWRYLYYKRFRETWQEQLNYNFYLGLLEDARRAPVGKPLFLTPTLQITREALAEGVVKYLEVQIADFHQRMTERGVLPEWPTLEEPPRDPALAEFIHSPARPTTFSIVRRPDAPSAS